MKNKEIEPKFTIMEYPIEIRIYNQAILLARKTKQTIGEKNNYYINLEQLMTIIKEIKKNN